MWCILLGDKYPDNLLCYRTLDLGAYLGRRLAPYTCVQKKFVADRFLYHVAFQKYCENDHLWLL
jgi:hypothetical protein